MNSIYDDSDEYFSLQAKNILFEASMHCTPPSRLVEIFHNAKGDHIQLLLALYSNKNTPKDIQEAILKRIQEITRKTYYNKHNRLNYALEKDIQEHTQRTRKSIEAFLKRNKKKK